MGVCSHEAAVARVAWRRSMAPRTTDAAAYDFPCMVPVAVPALVLMMVGEL